MAWTMPKLQLIQPDWPAPATVKAISSTRLGGVSTGCYTGLNVGSHVGDQPAAVAANRQLLTAAAAMPQPPLWLEQVHGVQVATLPRKSQKPLVADAAFSEQAGQVCTVMTADCLPVLLCDSNGTQVAAVHAGWRGLAAGVLEQTLAHFSRGSSVLAWLGPAIGPAVFEVGSEVVQQFTTTDPQAATAFEQQSEHKWLADLYQLARLRLQRAGVQAIYGGGYCTYSQAELFYSYRRDGQTGRMASCIWLQP
ncbi:conserved hypothetical protein [Alkalimonas amylolytica]|uniref:Purine nucleoside phosphorylase n=2 Tax=Alkalimonas amylolytica TaxID=152573 RepID=A0A1H4G4M2_ALKAM|nr:conserved hypothetical protein [Alkalimonas amylolytica]